jgi:predicted CxxxxCH...CXXCH cytochrome family protein
MTPECSQCHTVPRTHQAPGHVDDAPPIQAEINFKLLATHNGRVTPVWNAEAATCSDVYCHGGFTFRQDESAFPWAYTDAVMTGNNPTLTWTDVGSGAADCGTCHDLPPAGHIDAAASECVDCHGRVVDANLTIIDRGKHINGKVEVDLDVTGPRPGH